MPTASRQQVTTTKRKRVPRKKPLPSAVPDWHYWDDSVQTAAGLHNRLRLSELAAAPHYPLRDIKRVEKTTNRKPGVVNSGRPEPRPTLAPPKGFKAGRVHVKVPQRTRANRSILPTGNPFESPRLQSNPIFEAVPTGNPFSTSAASLNGSQALPAHFTRSNAAYEAQEEAWTNRIQESQRALAANPLTTAQLEDLHKIRESLKAERSKQAGSGQVQPGYPRGRVRLPPLPPGATAGNPFAQLPNNAASVTPLATLRNRNRSQAPATNPFQDIETGHIESGAVPRSGWARMADGVTSFFRADPKLSHKAQQRKKKRRKAVARKR